MKINFIRSSLAKIDIFGQNITLNMNKNASYTTAFGGFASILIIILLSLMFFSNISQFFSKEIVTYSQETVFSNDPELMIMNDENSMLAISISQTNFTTNPFFNITIQQQYVVYFIRIYTRYLNGTMEKKAIDIPLQPCILDRFNNVFLKQGIDFTDQFNFLGMSSMLCPIVNSTFELVGTYSSQTFRFMKVIVTTCQNNTNNQYWNPVCSSEQARQTYLNANAEFKLQFYQVNTVVNPQKPKNYQTVYIDSDVYFTFVPYKLARLANVYYRSYLINNDQSLLPYQDIEQEKIIVRKSDEFRDLTELGRDTDDKFAIVYLRRSPFTENIKRQYQKVGDLLSYLGGFMQIMKVVFGFVIVFYNRTSMLIELSNKLYSFKENEKQYVEQKTFKNTHQIINTTELKLNEAPPLEELDSVDWKKIFNNLVEKSKPIVFNFRLFINNITFGYLLRNQNIEFFERAMEKINCELDLHSILHQMQEIGKLKQVLLRKSQIVLFDFCQKPIIALGNEKHRKSQPYVIQQQKSYIQNREDQPDEQRFLKLKEAFKDITEEMEINQQNLCQMNINLKLAQLINSDITQLMRANSDRRALSPQQEQEIIKSQDEII